jgi:hypothetical protein
VITEYGLLRLVQKAIDALPEERDAWLRKYYLDYPEENRIWHTAFHEAAHAVALISHKVVPIRIQIIPVAELKAGGVVLAHPFTSFDVAGRFLLSGLIIEFDHGQSPAWPFAWDDVLILKRRLNALPEAEREARLAEVVQDAATFWHSRAASMGLHFLARRLVTERILSGESLRAACRTVARAFFPPSEARLIAAWHGAKQAGFADGERWLARAAQHSPTLAPLLLRLLPAAAPPPFDWDEAPKDRAPGEARQEKRAAGD